ncbi:MAG: Hsp20/alpha crystallin family protein [Prevotellaceae bacterium]|jgi:HSP20 family protein|nr:Hsp20/alpha crystallin family protein [Prevotellaceae bacterium]
MTLVRRNQNWLPSVFNDFFDTNWMDKTNATAPAINVKEGNSNFEIEVAAPGMTKNDFSIRIDEDNNLIISMEKKQENTEEDKQKRFLRREFGYSKFMQTMILPDNVDKDAIVAKMENGVLLISIPKLTEEELKKAQRQIEIQ